MGWSKSTRYIRIQPKPSPDLHLEICTEFGPEPKSDLPSIDTTKFGDLKQKIRDRDTDLIKNNVLVL